MAVTAGIPELSVVVFTALIDSINPCAIGVLILLVSTVIANAQSRKKLLTLGLTYIGAVYVTYLLAGLGLIYFMASIPIWIAEYVSIIVGLIIVLAGLVEIKDFYWYGRGFTLAIPSKMTKKIHSFSKNLTHVGMAILGAFVAGVELPCTGGPYLAVIMLLSQSFDLTAFLMLILYNLIFVLPLILILLLAYFGANIKDIKSWKEESRKYMRLATGLLLIFLGWLLILIADGTINFG